MRIRRGRPLAAITVTNDRRALWKGWTRRPKTRARGFGLERQGFSGLWAEGTPMGGKPPPPEPT